ncbi:secretin N-terminal domain-containing protein [Candidatus Omnitrophota bacterium]
MRIRRKGFLVASMLMILFMASALYAQTPEAAGPGEDKGAQDAGELKPGRITVNFKGADIRTVLSYLSEVSGVDIVPAPDITGSVDLKLTNKDWRTALDIIVKNYGYAYEQDGEIIRVISIGGLQMEELKTQAFSLSYAKSESVVTTIQPMLTRRGSISFDDRTNTILVTDVPTTVYKIGDIVRRLDASTPQVLIEAKIIETVLGDNEKLGVDWNMAFQFTGAQRPHTFPFNYYKPQANWVDKYYPLVQDGQTVITPIQVGNTVTATTQSPGLYPAGADGTGQRAKGFPYVDYADDMWASAFSFGTLDFSQFTALMEFIKDRSNTDIISNPRITTLDNKEASILVGHIIWMPTYERNKNTGAMEISGYEPKDVGVKLKVTPHINVRNEIIVEVEPEITELLRYDTLNEQEGVVVPVFSTRQAKTQVLMFNGDTAFIGGLIKEYDKKVVTKVPFLGDIFGEVPVLDLLFTHKALTQEKTELIFFVTVNLVTVGQRAGNAPTADQLYTPEYSLAQERWPPDRYKKKKK